MSKKTIIDTFTVTVQSTQGEINQAYNRSIKSFKFAFFTIVSEDKDKHSFVAEKKYEVDYPEE